MRIIEGIRALLMLASLLAELINPSGTLTLFDYTAATLPEFLALDGVSYVVSQ